MSAKLAELERLAAAIVGALKQQGFLRWQQPDAVAQRRIIQLIEHANAAEADLEQEAERLADSQGRALVGMDRRKIVLGIKARLARERGFPL